MRIGIETNGTMVAGMLREAKRQVRYAASVALTKTAWDVRRAEQAEMRAVFDRPTPWTLKSVMVDPAPPGGDVAVVRIGDHFDNRQHYLVPQIEGGRRVHKRFEELLRNRGILYRDEIAVPGDAARLNAYGNMHRSDIVRILSQVGALEQVAGAMQNATQSKRSRAKRKTKRYFYARQRETRVGGGAWKSGEKVQHLPSGIYLEDRADQDNGGFLKPVLMFVKRATYKPRFRFFEVAETVARDRFPVHFGPALDRAIATARWGRR